MKRSVRIASHALLPFVCMLASSACRDADENAPTNVVPITPSRVGANGCSGPDQTFTAGQVPQALVLGGFVANPSSHICAARGAELLYATGADETVVAIDVSANPPATKELVTAGAVATVISGAGIASAPLLSGIAVLDSSKLLVVERTSNTILSVDRTLPDTIAFFAGQPNTTPGFADGLTTGVAGLARFSFVAPTMICPTGDGRVFVADAGNHSIRYIQNGIVITAAGRGLAGFNDGNLSSALFDTPTGVSALCNMSLLVTELGGSGFGHRLRILSIGALIPFFGTVSGSSDTLVGTGMSGTTEGDATESDVAAPEAPFVTNGGEVYWIDSATGVFRRLKTDGNCDCPLATDCAAALVAPTFVAGHAFSMAGTDGGKLFVLDATASTLYRITP